MPISIYNSLSKRKEELIPLKKNTVNIYTCGVTVYDQCHIGHARSLYVFDVMKRYLKSRKLTVNFIRNITDVDDKIINKANESGKDWQQVVKENIDAYNKDLAGLGIDKADSEPRATENITDMIQHIEGLIKKEYAYEVDGDVYFDVRKFKDYGKLSGQSIEQMLEAVRIEKDVKKKDPLDFALWKKSKEDEPFWKSPWGKGRPGWHIECSVMSLKHLKCETLDIHAGGRDLIFPHHENEIAQAEALTGKPFAKYWVHHGLLTINGQKMAKSLGNFITIEDALKKYNVDTLKLFFLASHYASPVDFTEEKIKEAGKQRKSFNEFFDKVYTWRLFDMNTGASATVKDIDKIEEINSKFQQAMDDDFNTPVALACMFELIDLGASFISANKQEAFKKIHDILNDYFDIFGLKHREKIDVPKEATQIIEEREKARKDKDFKKADSLRDELKSKYSLIAHDTAGGVALTAIEGDEG